MEKKKYNIAVIGLGYVGLPLAVEFGKFHPTKGFDISSKRIEELRAFRDVTNECTHNEIEASVNLKFVSEKTDIIECDTYVVTVPTPIDSHNKPDLGPLILASEMIASILKSGDLVVYESTVYPGLTEEVCIPILEQSSGLLLNTDFLVGYSPERVNPGDKVNVLKNITKIVSGSNDEALSLVNNLYSSIIKAGTYEAKSIKIAEAAKVIENAQRDINIAFINELSMLFNELKIDTMDVLQAAASKWNFLPFKPGLVGGHCIGVDPYYLAYKAEQIQFNPQILLSGRKINEEMSKYCAKEILKLANNKNIILSKAKVAVLGVTFKENCPDIRNTKVFDLVEELKEWGFSIQLHDPVADPQEVKKEFGIDLSELSEIEVEILIIAVSHDLYRNFEKNDILKLVNKSGGVIGDLKSILNREILEDKKHDVFRL